MAGFRWFHQRELVSEYKLKFFEVVREVFQTREKEFAGHFAGNLFPYEPESDIVLEKSKVTSIISNSCIIDNFLISCSFESEFEFWNLFVNPEHQRRI